MKRNSHLQSAFLNARLFAGFGLCLLGVVIALLGFGFYPGGAARAATKKQNAKQTGKAEFVRLIGPVSLNKDLRNLPDIPQEEEEDEAPLMRYPFPRAGVPATNDPLKAVRRTLQAIALPTPSATYPGITSAQSACGCLPPDTDGDVGPNHYIQAVNSRFKIIDKSGNQLVAPTTYNSFFAALGTSTPCGANQNGGDAIVFYDPLADRWVISDFAFPGFPGTSFYQCIGVSKTSDPVAGGWWLYALQVDPNNTNYLGDYPKFGMWPDAYYVTMNLFSNNTTFNGVRAYALPRLDMINGTGAPNPGAIGFTIDPTTLGDAYSLVPASFRTGTVPSGTTEYLLAVNSSSVAGTVENKVFAWRFHPDFTTPANSTFGVGANHAPDASITVAGFVDAFTSAGTTIVPQNGTARTLDTLGDKIMYPIVYQNLAGTESLWAVQTVNNNQNGTGPSSVRWYQFDVTGGTIPATPAQQQTFDNSADGLWRFMPGIALDSRGNMAISYSVSSATSEPSIRYVGRVPGDPLNTLPQGETVLQAGGGHQTSTSSRWGDYSALNVDPTDNLTFWATNGSYSATSSSAWNTRIGTFKFPAATPQLLSAVSRQTHGTAGDFDIPMPLTGPTGVEDRQATTYNIVLTFDAPVTSADTSLTNGTGTAGAPTFSGNTMTVPLTGITDSDAVMLTVNNVNGTLPSATVPLGFLVGDSNADRFTNVGDTIEVRARAGQDVDATNFRSDLNHDGLINVGDTTLARSKSGNALP